MSTNPSAFSGGLTQATSSPWLPGDNGLLAASCDPAFAGQGVALTAGTLNLSLLPVRSTILITNLWIIIGTAGAGASTGSFMGLYNQAGTLLSGSADIGASLVTAGVVVKVPLTTPQTIIGGAESTWPWVALLVNLATTQPSPQRSTGGPAVVGGPNLNLSAPLLRGLTNGTALAALPSTITPASGTPGPIQWVGAS